MDRTGTVIRSPTGDADLPNSVLPLWFAVCFSPIPSRETAGRRVGPERLRVSQPRKTQEVGLALRFRNLAANVGGRLRVIDDLEAVLECVRVVRLGIISNERSHVTGKYAGFKAGNVDLFAYTCVHHCPRAFDSTAPQRSLL